MGALFTGVTVFALLVIARSILKAVGSTLLRHTSETIRDPFNGFVSKLSFKLFAVIAILSGARSLAWFSEEGLSTISSVISALSILQIVLCLHGGVVAVFSQHEEEERNIAKRSALGVLRFGVLLILWSFGFLLLLDNWGMDITSLVAGLGVGGIAVALAVQSLLGDVLGSVSIVLERPFEVGDFIAVDDFMGTVQQIGIKTTRVASLSGEQIIFPNSDLLSARVRNYGRMSRRRVEQSFGVLYSTSVEQLQSIKNSCKEIISNQSNCELDRVHFDSFGASSLDFVMVYFIQTPDYNIFMDIKEKINLELIRSFSGLGVDFAFPTRTLYLTTEEPLKLSDPEHS